ncbi:MAG: energy-coupled thiamine transporter ThiT [Lachnospiraceae bacterium]|nr:energy-coupled thiamine transporter ThiT [Lachnospiraceae bacterium]
MSLFLTYDAQNAEYLLKPAGYAVLAAALILLLIVLPNIGRQKHRPMKTKQLVFCSAAMALAVIASFIKFASLPFGGSITMFSMLFICLIGYFYGPRVGLITGVAYGILQLITGPYIYAPLQVILDYPAAFAALGLSGFFYKAKHGLVIGYITGCIGRYICHVISGYIFFASYAPESMNPMLYTLGYNATYIVPELIATVVILMLPPVRRAIALVKQQAV